MLRLLFLFTIINSVAIAQKDSVLIYRPEADAKMEIGESVKKAKAEKKHVMLMIGGNWCRWCKMFDAFSHANAKVDSTMKADFIFLHVNYSKENKNLDVLKSLSYPQRFGFPVFVVLDDEGKVVHTQNSAYLEEKEGYSEEKVVDFLHQWRKDAFNPEYYLK
ncbi:MAG: thioredoxin family protein [Bacteroidetes bacterium]|nr:thioredoxin family protein [Bacteroidota bacterium]